MLLWLLNSLAVGTLSRTICPSLEKTTLRAALAAFISFALALVFGGRLITWLRRHFREPIKTASPRVAELHAAKQATPTMGGLFIAAGIVISTALLADMSNPLVWLGVALTVALAALGAVDDLAKLRTFEARHVGAGVKLTGQSVIALVVRRGRLFRASPHARRARSAHSADRHSLARSDCGSFRWPC